MNNTDPIELFIASLLYLFEGICYIINELAGFHNHPATRSPSDLGSTKATASESLRASSATVSTKPFIQPQATPFIQPLFTDLTSLTKRQLQTLTGIKSNRYNKIQLLSIAAAY